MNQKSKHERSELGWATKSGLACMAGSVVIFISGWILVYVIQDTELITPSAEPHLELLGMFVYFSSALPVIPASFGLVGILLLAIGSWSFRG